MTRQTVQLVWFRRDLRVRDHAPLYQAAFRGPVLPLYVIEPGRLKARDFAPRHWTFLAACLADLNENLLHLGQPLVLRIGDMIPVLEQLGRGLAIAAIWTHQETGTGPDRRREQVVRRWAQQQGVAFHELPQDGVIREPYEPRVWDQAWREGLDEPLTPVPQVLKPVRVHPGRIPDPGQLRLGRDSATMAQPGGENEARLLLERFVAEGALRYRPDEPGPAEFAAHSSRLSPHLALGSISVKTVYQAAQTRRREWLAIPVAERDDSITVGLTALRVFTDRLRRRGRDLQLLVDRPNLDQEDELRVDGGLRPAADTAHLLAAWRQGQTGFPLVDAAMRALEHTGWLEASLRSLVASLAVNHLGLDWRAPAEHLARLFVDYEPGILYPQMQRQAGTLAARPAPIVDPVRLGRALDPAGAFIRRWLPELTDLPDAFIHAPWTMPMWSRPRLDFVLGRDYPAPLVEHQGAARRARARQVAIRRDPANAAALAARGGHRSAPPAEATDPGPAGGQLALDLE